MVARAAVVLCLATFVQLVVGREWCKVRRMRGRRRRLIVDALRVRCDSARDLISLATHVHANRVIQVGDGGC